MLTQFPLITCCDISSLLKRVFMERIMHVQIKPEILIKKMLDKGVLIK